MGAERGGCGPAVAHGAGGFCDLTAPILAAQLDQFQTLSIVRCVRQIVGRAPGEDAQTGTNELLHS